MKTSEFRKQYKTYAKKHSINRSTPPLEKHDQHQVEIRPVNSWKHRAEYHCLSCNKHVAWIGKRELSKLTQLGLFVPPPEVRMTRDEFFRD
jgi:hypothetical protein